MSYVELIEVDEIRYRTYNEIDESKETNKDNTYTYMESLSTPLSALGAIMGYRNENLKRLERDTGTRISYKKVAASISFGTTIRV